MSSLHKLKDFSSLLMLALRFLFIRGHSYTSLEHFPSYLMVSSSKGFIIILWEGLGIHHWFSNISRKGVKNVTRALTIRDFWKRYSWISIWIYKVIIGIIISKHLLLFYLAEEDPCRTNFRHNGQANQYMSEDSYRFWFWCLPGDSYWYWYAYLY